MKKQVSNFVKMLGGNTEYSGNRKTMFIRGTKNVSAHHLYISVIKIFGYDLHFKLVY